MTDHDVSLLDKQTRAMEKKLPKNLIVFVDSVIVGAVKWVLNHQGFAMPAPLCALLILASCRFCAQVALAQGLPRGPYQVDPLGQGWAAETGSRTP